MNVTDFLKEFWFLWALIILIFIYKLFQPAIKGYVGEKTISFFLSRLNPEKYKVINDVMLKKNGRTTQIDHVVVSEYGIFVIETKNYKGWIYGEENNNYWTQVLYKRKEKLYNPVWQNKGHVKALKENLQDYPNLVYIPIVVFSTTANLKIKTTSTVIKSPQLIKTIKNYNQKIISNSEVDEIVLKIKSMQITDKEAKKEHVKAIRQDKKIERTKVSGNVCPKCGNPLILRKGKFGSFKGCSGYPKCRFTINN